MRSLARPRARPRSTSTAATARASFALDAHFIARDRIDRRVIDGDAFYVDRALAPGECAAIVEAVERAEGFTLARSRGSAFGEAERKHGRYQCRDDAFANALWKRCERFFDFDVDEARGLNENIRVYRYQPGEKFGAHVDEKVRANGNVSKYTAIFYLNDVEDGGRTIFYDERGAMRSAVEPKTGRALFFRHGIDCCEHEGEEVRKGVKYVLRSDVMF